MEGQNLLSMVKGRVYNAELRTELTQLGMRRIGSYQWICKETAEKFEFILSDDEPREVRAVDLVDGNHRIRLKEAGASEEEQRVDDLPTSVNLNVHHKTANAIFRQLEVSDHFFDIMDSWNDEMYRGTALGSQLRALCNRAEIHWTDFLYLPDPMATGEYLFATFRKGVAASIHAWLQMPDERYYVPTDGSVDGAYDSLQTGLEFHTWEAETFDTPAAAGQYAIRMLNNSETTYAQTIRRLLGKENGKISRNDFYRNKQNQMCRILVVRDDQGLHFTDELVKPTVSDCIDSLLAPYIRLRALQD